MNKRGVELALEELLGLALAGVILVTAIYAIIQFTGALTGESTEPSMIALRVVSDRVDELVGRDDLIAIQSVPIQLLEGDTLVAFGRKDDSVHDKCGVIEIEKPVECGANSCLCLYEDLPITPGEKIGMPKKCMVSSQVYAYYSLLGFDGDVRDTSGLKSAEDAYNEQPLYALRNNLGGPVAADVDFPKPVSNFVLHGLCDQVTTWEWVKLTEQPGWGLNALYLEKYIDTNGRTNMLITPVSPLTDRRYSGEIRGLPFEEYIKQLQRQKDLVYCESVEKDVACFDSERIAKIYTKMRQLHPDERVDDILLRELADRLRRSHPEVSSSMYRDLAAWHPNSKFMPEALYARMILTYPPENIAVPGSYTIEQQQKIAGALQEAGKLIDGVKVILEDDKVATEKKEYALPYYEYGHFVRALYYVSQAEYVKARDDLQAYQTFGEKTYGVSMIDGHKPSYVDFAKTWSYVLEKEPLPQ